MNYTVYIHIQELGQCIFSVMTRLWTGWFIPYGHEIYLFSEVSRLALNPSYPPVKWVI